MINRQTLKTIALTTAVFIAVVLLYQGYRLYIKAADYANVPAGFAYIVPNADVTVIEFADYGCPYCREVHETITNAVRRDGRVNYVPRIIPYRNPDAALLAYAAGKQGQFLTAHDMLMREQWAPTTANILSFANRLGVDPLKLQDDFNHPTIKNLILNNIDLYKRLGTGATPSFIIQTNNNETTFVPEGQMPNVDDFLQMFDAARNER